MSDPLILPTPHPLPCPRDWNDIRRAIRAAFPDERGERLVNGLDLYIRYVLNQYELLVGNFETGRKVYPGRECREVWMALETLQVHRDVLRQLRDLFG